MASLHTQIAVFTGHDIPADASSPCFFGTVGELQAENPNWLKDDVLQECLDRLDEDGVWRYGGGAEQAFIALRVHPVPGNPFANYRSLEDITLGRLPVAGHA